ncbi:hypothetical protein MPSI1_001524 [Malassezia psittaci]|uniref:PhoD-like phosphatase domain-containing protein n=1 Tax=Malassezia psittaci TaxID=1821823 RepID=A0AAF0FAF4_9BASI|nr:hypothetical protein MPSI1_001524 [Malassezia psittaci]
MSVGKREVGPLLRYDTVDKEGIYHAFALVVTSSGPDGQVKTPVLQYTPFFMGDTEKPNGKAMQSEAAKIWVYKDESNNLHHFWRFKIEVPLLDQPQQVAYQIPELSDVITFHVPAARENFRWVGHSCNGFSSSVDTKSFNGADPLWRDVMNSHADKPYHICMGGGDQIYCDKISQEKELSVILNADNTKPNPTPVSPEIETAIDRFYFFNYVKWFGNGKFSEAAARIPMVNMLDDHDLIDGFGTYPDDLMQSPVFNRIGGRGYFFYLLFQQFMNDEVDNISNTDTSDPNPSIFRSLIIGGPGAFVPFPTHSLLVYLGPKQYMLLIDCRAQRKLLQVCAPDTYNRCIAAVEQLPKSVEHLIVQLGVPICYPRMVKLEKMLESKYNPVVGLAKLLIPGFANSFNGQVELLDDLNDHWCAAHHKRERNQLIERMQEVALKQRLRISFISGDVHAGGCGLLYTALSVHPAHDHRYMLAVITSAIVNSPPPPAVITMMNWLSRKKHRSLFYVNTREKMLPLFEYDLEDKKQHNKYIMGARNWCAAYMDESTGELVFDLHVERSRGSGESKVYAMRAPPPRYK